MNIKTISFNAVRVATVVCWQHDYGQYIDINAEDITDDDVVQWSYAGISGVDTRPIENKRVRIPDNALAQAGDVFGYIYHFTVDYGMTIYKIYVRIQPRPSTDENQSADDIAYLQGIIQQTIDALADLESRIDQLVEHDVEVMLEEQPGGRIIIRRYS